MSTASRNVLVFITLMILVTAATWALGLMDIKYKVESEVAFTDGFPGDTSQWQPAGDWSNVDISEEQITVLRDSPNRSYAKRNFALPDYEGRASHKLRIRGTVNTVTPVVKPVDEPGAAYMVWLQDNQDEVLKYLTIQNLSGSQSSYAAERVISIPEAVSSFTLVLNSRDAVNTFSLTDASAQIISVTPLYRIASILLICGWLAIFIFCARWLYQNASRSLFVTTSLLIAGIVIGVMLPESATVGFVDPLFKAVAGKLPAFDDGAAQSTYKAGHFLFFFLISLVLMLNSKSFPTGNLPLLFVLILFAIASEGMQLHLFNRTTRLSDIGIDSAGILLGWLLARIIGLARKS